MSLSHNDIIWTIKGMDEVAIIDHCGEYPNVPLIGTNGGITYNPCLALRQFGRARREGPHDLLMPSIVFDFQGDSDAKEVGVFCSKRIKTFDINMGQGSLSVNSKKRCVLKSQTLSS